MLVGNGGKIAFVGVTNGCFTYVDRAIGKRNAGVFINQGCEPCPVLRSQGMLIVRNEIVQHHCPVGVHCMVFVGTDYQRNFPPHCAPSIE